MSITFAKTVVKFPKFTTVEEAEGLLEWFESNPKGKVNLAQAEHIHTAVLQLLLLKKPSVSAWPKDLKLASLMHQILNNG